MLSGSFSDYNTKVSKSEKSSIGFISNKSNAIPKLEKNCTEALFNAGIIPELVGRLSSIVKLNKLTKKNLRNILVNKRDSVFHTYKKLFSYTDLKFDDDDILKKVVNNAYKLKTGARGLKTALEQLLETNIFKVKKIDAPEPSRRALGELVDRSNYNGDIKITIISDKKK